MAAGGDTDDGGESFDRVRAGLAGRLRARRDELVREIFARVSGDGFDRAGENDAEYVEGLRATVVAALEYVLAGIEHGGDGSPPTRPVPAVALEQAQRAARAGVPLDTVLRRYLTGHTLLEEYVMEEADRGERDGWALNQREALRGALRAQASALDRLLQAITAAYGNELQGVERSPERRRNEWVKRLLDGGAAGDSELDYKFDAWHLGVIAVGTGAAQAVGELAVGLDRRLLSVPQGERSVWAWLGGPRSFDMTALQRGLSAGVSFAVGEPARGLDGWRLTHRQAQAALVVALRRNGIPPTLTRYADVALLASALKDEMLASTLTGVYISPLEDSRDSGPVLRETLRAYLAAERSVSSAAARLGVVRKTVENRLRAIEEKIGRTLHPCPPELEIALELDELTRDSITEVAIT